MKIIPLNDNVLLQVLAKEETSTGGLYLAPSKADRHELTRAKVLAVGPGRVTSNGVRIEPTLVRGDTVLAHVAGGSSVDLGDGTKGIMVSEADIAAAYVGPK